MASRYGAFSRSARNSFASNGSTFTFRAARNGTARTRSGSGSQSQSSFQKNYMGNESGIFRRRWAETSIPLHSAIAAAKLISHLSFSSRSTRSALPLGLRGYIDILPVRHMVVP